MFDFLRWREWLRLQVEVLAAEGFATELKTNDKHLPGSAIEAEDGHVIGSFSNWENGLADYDILDTRSGQMTTKWGVQVSDQSFESFFSEFVGHLRRLR